MVATTTSKKSDYISHHLPVKSVLDNIPVKSNVPGEKYVRSSRAMTTSRKIGAAFITVAHFFSIFAIYDMFTSPFMTVVKWFTATYLLYVISGTLGITAGAHRLWAHRSYKANLPARIIIMIANCIANQSSIYHWAIEHRVHHRHVDSEADPHNINEGFFYCHMGWLFKPRSDAFAAARKLIDDSDLKADKVVMFQDKYYLYLSLFLCYFLPAAAGKYFADDWYRGFMYLSMLRWVITLHVTWSVNSFTHTFGYRPYSPDQKAAENGIVSFFTGGEGWHNWHHTYPWDYAASESNADVFWRFNLARFWIDSFAALGMVTDRKVQHRHIKKPMENIEEHQ